MTTTINKTIGIGDAGLPFNVSIDVEYEQQGNLIMVTDWQEDASPYDNPPDKWWDRIKEIIAEFFYEQDDNNEVVFK
jgi:hypothetical protein